MVIKVGARHQVVNTGSEAINHQWNVQDKERKENAYWNKDKARSVKRKGKDHSGVPPHMAPKKIFAWPTTPARTPAEFGDDGGGDGCVLCGDRDSSLLLILQLLTSFFEDLLRDSEWRLAAFRVTTMAEGEGLDGPTATAAAVKAAGAGLFVVGETIAFGGQSLVPGFGGTELSFLSGCSDAELSTVDELDEVGVEAEMMGLVLSVCCGA